MSQFRQNPLTGQWVSIAPNRAERPLEFESGDSSGGVCPFCEGQESGTPPESLALRNSRDGANGPGWKVRIVPNRYPFVSPVAGVIPAFSDSLFQIRPSDGIQEVIIESPKHLSGVTDLSTSEWADVLSVYRQRLGQLQADGRWQYALLFKNSGEAAGASLSHIHSQLIALPTVPAAVENMLTRFREHFQKNGSSILTDLIDRECAAGERLVYESEHFVVICPFASRSPYELQIIPRRQAANFSEVADPLLEELAALLRNLIGRLEKVYESLAFNWLFHTCPFDTISQDYYHWHVEVVPRVTKTAGYEWATGYAVNTVSPESAAHHLRCLGGSAGEDLPEKR